MSQTFFCWCPDQVLSCSLSLYMQLSDKKEVLLAPLCSARAIGTRFVAIPEKQVTLEVKTHPSSPSHNYTGLNLAFTGYVNGGWHLPFIPVLAERVLGNPQQQP